MCSKLEEDSGHHHLIAEIVFCYDALLVSTNDENGVSSMDIAESIPPDSRCEIDGENRISGTLKKNSSGSLDGCINAEAANAIPSSSSCPQRNKDLLIGSLDMEFDSSGDLIDERDLNKKPTRTTYREY